MKRFEWAGPRGADLEVTIPEGADPRGQSERAEPRGPSRGGKRAAAKEKAELGLRILSQQLWWKTWSIEFHGALK